MNREVYLKNIADSLALLSTQVSIRNAINLYDINIVAEDFYPGLLNLIYDYQLENANNVEKNASGIDLIDKINRISIQVTSDKSSKKIKHTIEEFNKNERYKEYDRLVVLILVEKTKYTAVFDTAGKFVFDKDVDIWDRNDLITEIRGFDIHKLKKINDYLQAELNEKYANSSINEANEVETIIDLIEYISGHKQVKKLIDVEIDPDYKIFNRFKEFASSLIEQYMALLSLYGSALENVYVTLGIDQAQDLVTMFYLQEISMRFLEDANNNPTKALDTLVEYFENKLSTNGKKYDRMAIKFYLVNEMIKCSVFPNERSEYYDSKS